MAKDQIRRNSPKTLKNDLEALASVVGLQGYSPNNADHSIVNLTAARKQLVSAQKAEIEAIIASKAARDNANDAEWAFHNLMLGAKQQVIAQFGADSNAVQAVGLKKKSEYKPKKRRNAAK